MKFVDFLESHVVPAQTIERAHDWLVQHAETPDAVLPIRATGRFLDGPTERAAREHRARVVLLQGAQRKVVFCDNELPAWLFQTIALPGFLNQSFAEKMAARIAPVADARAAGEGDGSFLCQSVPRPWGSAYNHKHIFDAGLPKGSNNSRFSRSQLLSKFFRLVHPINWFLFPTGLGYDAEQNSRPEFQFVAAVFMSRHAPHAFEDFLARIRPGELGWHPEWRERGEAEFDSLHLEDSTPPPTRTAPAVAPARGLRPFFVDESASGRFHLNKFGRTTGGDDRQRPFVFVVRDPQEEPLLESHPTTAADLGIAERGRGNYDDDVFFQKDFVVRSANGAVTPSSPIALRVPWK